MPNEFNTAHEIVEAELANTAQHEQQLPPPGPKLIEWMLSPRSLGLMMTSGGGLLVTGFVVWLWSIGVFQNPLVVVTTVGATNLIVLGIGIWLLQSTRYKIAGRGLTLLSSLVLPLNLWLYDAQRLITLDDGGQLWIPALVCCMIYAVVARITRDSLFMYTFVGGIVITGSLFLAGAPGELFWSILPITTFLVAVGTICIIADRWFLDSDGDFSRSNFGLATFRSGHAVLITGLAILAGAHIGHMAADVFSTSITNFYSPELLVSAYGKIWTLVLLVVSAATYFYSSCNERKHTVFLLLLILVSTWAVINTIALFNISITVDMGLLLVSAVVIVANLTRTLFPKASDDQKLLYVELAFSTSMILMLIAVYRYVAMFLIDEILFIDWMHVALLFAAAASLLTLPGVWTKQNQILSEAAIFIASAGLMLTAVVAIFGLETGIVAYILTAATAAPLVISIATTLFANSAIANRTNLVVVALSTVPFLLWTGLLLNENPLVGFATLPSIAMLAIISASCSMTSYTSGSRAGLALALTTFAIAIVQLTVFFDLVNAYVIISTVTITGFAILTAGKLAKRLNLANVSDDQSITLQQLGHCFVYFGVAGTILFVAFALLASQAVLAHLGLLAFQLAAIVVAAMSTRNAGWRQAYLVAATATIGVSVLTVSLMSTLTIYQRMELASLTLGSLTVIAGYIGWSREAGKRSDVVTLNLVAGSWLLVIPLMIGVIGDRVAGDQIVDAWRTLHEIGGLTIGLALLGSGILCQIRSTTLSGGSLLCVFVLSNILLINLPEQLQSASVMMMIGGGLFFGTAILLSVYRDRIVSLPKKIRDGKGLFRVLKWR